MITKTGNFVVYIDSSWSSRYQMRFLFSDMITVKSALMRYLVTQFR